MRSDLHGVSLYSTSISESVSLDMLFVNQSKKLVFIKVLEGVKSKMATRYNEIKMRQLQYLSSDCTTVQTSLAVQYNSKVDTPTLAPQQHMNTVKFKT